MHGEKIIKKLMSIYSNPKEAMDSRLHIGEAILQTIQRCGDALGKYSELPRILTTSWNLVISEHHLTEWHCLELVLTLPPPLLQIIDKYANTMSALSIINWFQDLVD